MDAIGDGTASMSQSAVVLVPEQEADANDDDDVEGAYGQQHILLPSFIRVFHDPQAAMQWVHPNPLDENAHARVMLATTNAVVDGFNVDFLRDLPGESRMFYSCHEVERELSDEHRPSEAYMQKISESGVPAHELQFSATAADRYSVIADYPLFRCQCYSKGKTLNFIQLYITCLTRFK